MNNRDEFRVLGVWTQTERLMLNSAPTRTRLTGVSSRAKAKGDPGRLTLAPDLLCSLCEIDGLSSRPSPVSSPQGA